jgi:hypothetical protein
MTIAVDKAHIAAMSAAYELEKTQSAIAVDWANKKLKNAHTCKEVMQGRNIEFVARTEFSLIGYDHDKDEMVKVNRGTNFKNVEEAAESNLRPFFGGNSDLMTKDSAQFAALLESNPAWKGKNWSFMGHSRGGMDCCYSAIKAMESHDLKVKGVFLLNSPLYKVDGINPLDLLRSKGVRVLDVAYVKDYVHGFGRTNLDEMVLFDLPDDLRLTNPNFDQNCKYADVDEHSPEIAIVWATGGLFNPENEKAGHNEKIVYISDEIRIRGDLFGDLYAKKEKLSARKCPDTGDIILESPDIGGVTLDGGVHVETDMRNVEGRAEGFAIDSNGQPCRIVVVESGDGLGKLVKFLPMFGGDNNDFDHVFAESMMLYKARKDIAETPIATESALRPARSQQCGLCEVSSNGLEASVPAAAVSPYSAGDVFITSCANLRLERVAEAMSKTLSRMELVNLPSPIVPQTFLNQIEFDKYFAAISKCVGDALRNQLITTRDNSNAAWIQKGVDAKVGLQASQYADIDRQVAEKIDAITKEVQVMLDAVALTIDSKDTVLPSNESFISRLELMKRQLTFVSHTKTNTENMMVPVLRDHSYLSDLATKQTLPLQSLLLSSTIAQASAVRFKATGPAIWFGVTTADSVSSPTSDLLMSSTSMVISLNDGVCVHNTMRVAENICNSAMSISEDFTESGPDTGNFDPWTVLRYDYAKHRMIVSQGGKHIAVGLGKMDVPKNFVFGLGKDSSVCLDGVDFLTSSGFIDYHLANTSAAKNVTPPAISIDPSTLCLGEADHEKAFYASQFHRTLLTTKLGKFICDADYLIKQWATGNVSHDDKAQFNIPVLEATENSRLRFWIVPTKANVVKTKLGIIFADVGMEVRVVSSEVVGPPSSQQLRDSGEAPESCKHFFGPINLMMDRLLREHPLLKPLYTSYCAYHSAAYLIDQIEKGLVRITDEVWQIFKELAAASRATLTSEDLQERVKLLKGANVSGGCYLINHDDINYHVNLYDEDWQSVIDACEHFDFELYASSNASTDSASSSSGVVQIASREQHYMRWIMNHLVSFGFSGKLPLHVDVNFSEQSTIGDLYRHLRTAQGVSYGNDQLIMVERGGVGITQAGIYSHEAVTVTLKIDGRELNEQDDFGTKLIDIPSTASTTIACMVTGGNWNLRCGAI